MSRLGKKPVVVPDKVKVQISGNSISVEGPKGKLDYELPNKTQVELKDNEILISRSGDDKEAKERHGLCRALVQNMVTGVSEGFSRKLEIHGVGFKAAVKDKVIDLNLGYSHTINYAFPESVEVKVEDQTKITVEGPDRQKVGQVAADIRSFYPVEPYKGKGVRYADERVVRKEGKKAG
jgi:large subunit ribosomal protein L6